MSFRRRFGVWSRRRQIKSGANAAALHMSIKRIRADDFDRILPTTLSPTVVYYVRSVCRILGRRGSN